MARQRLPHYSQKTMNKKVKILLEWGGSLGIILSIILYGPVADTYSNQVQIAAGLAIFSNTLLGTVSFHYGLYGIVLMCLFTTGAHILNLSL